MNKEQYVSFKLAKLLKEKGFNWPCTHYYYDDGTIHKALDYVRQNDGEDDDNDECLCPTQQMACRWMREEKGIHPELELCTDNEFSFTIYKLDDKRTVLYEEKHCWTKPEDAIEAALQYCLTNLV